MLIPTYATVIEKLFGLVDAQLHRYVYQGYHTLTVHLRYPLGLAVVVYFMVTGLAISQGWARLSLGQFVKMAFKLGLIYAFAMNWGHFSFFVMQGIQGTAGQIGDWLIWASPIPLPHFAGEGIIGALQSLLIEVVKVGAWTWDKGSWHDWSPLLAGVCIWGFGCAAIIVAVVEMVLAKLMLAILFTLAPLFISLTLFKPTHGLFDRWLGSIIGFALFFVMIPAAIALGMSFMQWAVGGFYLMHALHISLVSFIPIALIGVLDLILIQQVTGLAKHTGGAVASASGSSMTAGVVGGAIGAGLSMSGFGVGSMVKGARLGLVARKKWKEWRENRSRKKSFKRSFADISQGD